MTHIKPLCNALAGAGATHRILGADDIQSRAKDIVSLPRSKK